MNTPQDNPRDRRANARYIKKKKGPAPRPVFRPNKRKQPRRVASSGCLFQEERMETTAFQSEQDIHEGVGVHMFISMQAELNKQDDYSNCW